MATSANNSENLVPEQASGRRVTVDLTAAAGAEVKRLQGITGLSTADIFRFALNVFRIYVDARQQGQHVYLIDEGTADKTRLELPITVAPK